MWPSSNSSQNDAGDTTPACSRTGKFERAQWSSISFDALLTPEPRLKRWTSLSQHSRDEQVTTHIQPLI
jgi:hypothetical protein